MSKYIHVSSFEQDAYPVTFIIGARGVGKTVHALSENLKRCFENGTQFIYLRRYQTEIDTLSINLALLSDLIGHEITLDNIKDESGRTSKMILVDGEPVCYILALSVASKYKSNDYSKVDKIVYDEFIDINGRELKNETKLFINFAMTVFRDFSKYRALFLANATDLYNCYFLDFEVMPRSTVTKFHDKGIKIIMYRTNAELDDERLNTVLAKQVGLIEGADGSSLSNNFDNQFNDFLDKVKNGDKYICTYRLNGAYYGMFYHQADQRYIISDKADLTFKRKKALKFEDATNDFPVVDFDDFSALRGIFKGTHLFFTNAKTRTYFIKYLKKGMYSD